MSPPPILRRGLYLGGLIALAGIGFALTWFLTRPEMPPEEAPEGMVWIPAGTFQMGDSSKEPIFKDALPVHEVELDGFWIDRTEVTNAQFAQFVEATNYVTIAERKPELKYFPGLTAEQLPKEPMSQVFTPPAKGTRVRNHLDWWRLVVGADWRHPDGPKSDLKGKENHPVVHIAYDDAVAYATWAGKRLPTEAEWEYAARGGLKKEPFVWGSELRPGGKWMANIWQGNFPFENTKEDGYVTTAPVASFPANGYGLHDMAGNVWEWCSDWYRPDYYRLSSRKNPPGPAECYDPDEPGLPKRVQRGGSFLCAEDTCVRYRPAGRGKGEVYSATSHLGFRCVRSKKP